MKYINYLILLLLHPLSTFSLPPPFHPLPIFLSSSSSSSSYSSFIHSFIHYLYISLLLLLLLLLPSFLQNFTHQYLIYSLISSSSSSSYLFLVAVDLFLSLGQDIHIIRTVYPLGNSADFLLHRLLKVIQEAGGKVT